MLLILYIPFRNLPGVLFMFFSNIINLTKKSHPNFGWLFAIKMNQFLIDLYYFFQVFHAFVNRILI